MTRKRSKYRPTGVNPEAFLMAFRGAHKLDTKDQLVRAVPVHDAVKSLIDCKGGEDEWRLVFDALNMIEALAYVGPVRDAKDFIAEQAHSIIAVMDRHRETRSNVLRPAECQLLRDLSATWAEVLAVVTCREYFEAEQRVGRKTVQALAGGSHGSVRVLEAVSA